jgi:hypothetical protein
MKSSPSTRFARRRAPATPSGDVVIVRDVAVGVEETDARGHGATASAGDDARRGGSVASVASRGACGACFRGVYVCLNEITSRSDGV